MKKYLFVSVVWLVACAGNPPDWWNPSNRYTQATSKPKPVASRQPVAGELLPQISEEENSFEADMDFEEMSLTEDANENQAAIEADDKLSPSLLE